ncbi:MAG: folylpolyglutamate synthase/dihydrofolate synthase family protein [Pseudomonadota bacterium]
MREHPVLAAAAQRGVRLGLERMQRFMRAFGSPHQRYPIIHVAGTNGKGSVTHMIAEVLRQQGFRVGLYTSPHLQHVNERIKVGGRPISDRDLGELLDRVGEQGRGLGRDLLALEEDQEALTFFETCTAAAFLHFAEVGVDVAVVEVGMGGRLDATNICTPVVTAITSIGLDHTEVLGPDIASIAAEKAGILKPGVPVVAGGVPPDALRVIRAMAQTRGARLLVCGEDFHVSRDGDAVTWQGPGGRRQGFSVGMAGIHQVDNAAVAMAVIDLLPLALACDDAATRVGIAQARIDGRLEWLAPDVLIDAAHNQDGAITLATYLRRRGPQPRRTLVLGCSREKDIRAIGALLAPHFSRVLTSACAHPRAMAPGDVAAALEGLSVPVMPAGPIEQALPLARAGGGEVVVAGSIFLIGAVRDLLGVR